MSSEFEQQTGVENGRMGDDLNVHGAPVIFWNAFIDLVRGNNWVKYKPNTRDTIGDRISDIVEEVSANIDWLIGI